MAFKQVNVYNEERYGNFFILQNDGDCADVVFLYRDIQDELVAEAVHYLKTDSYRGYVHCIGAGCPACAKKIRVQTKLFIPLYNIDADEIQFFDRTMKFGPQFKHDVFDRYPNPSQCIARITRHGVAGDINTKYQIDMIGKNTIGSYDQILAKFNATFPQYYNVVCRELTSAEMATLLNTSTSDSANYSSKTDDLPDYVPTPRVSVPTPIAEPPRVDAYDSTNIADSDEDVDDPVF